MIKNIEYCSISKKLKIIIYPSQSYVSQGGSSKASSKNYIGKLFFTSI